MKRIIIAPDSFKGTLSALEVCETVSAVLKKRYPDTEIISLPIADGGEGTVDAFLCSLGGEKQSCRVHSPLGSQTEAFYGLLPDGTAIIEMAAASGITLEKEKNALKSSSYGTGELILSAIEKGVRRFIVGIGGSATTDGGTGMLSALGARFLDGERNELYPCGESLIHIEETDLSGLDIRLRECEITVLCDVRNPLYGKTGAAYVFAPQKGADEREVRLLDEGLRKFADVSAKALGKDYALNEGAGAAGGLGFALNAYLGARLVRGTEFILDITDFRKKVKNADLIITGEGKTDSQSLMGKVPFTVAAASGGGRVMALVGVCEISPEEAKKRGIDEIVETNPHRLPFEKVKLCAKQMLIDACKDIII